MSINLPDTPSWLHSGNAKIIFAKLLQSAPPAYRHELLPDSTGRTQIVYDFVDAAHPDTPLVVLFHGLEGSSMDHYAVEMMKAVQRRNWHDVVAHFHGCGNIINAAPMFYHSGGTREIGFTLETLAARYSRIYAAGASLGGNALVKYLGEEGAAAVPCTAATVSVPVGLTAAGTHFDHGMTRLLYTRYFLRSLISKIEIFPRFQMASPLKSYETLDDFDDPFTVPLHGFTNQHDYYHRASCKPLLRSMCTPLLSLNAVSNPFLPPEALLTAVEVSNAVALLQPPCGGYARFVNRLGGQLSIEWMSETVLHYFEAHGREAI